VDVQYLSLLEEYGVPIVFATVLIAQLGMPIPAIAVLIAAGALAGDDHPAVLAFALSGLAGCIIADCLWFAIGRHYGLKALRTLYRIAWVSDASARRFQQGFENFGWSSLVAAKFVPGLSLIVPPLSGALGMRWPTFVLFSSMGSVLWVVVGIGAGIVLADEISELLKHVGNLGRTAAPVLLALGLGYLARRWWVRHCSQARR